MNTLPPHLLLAIAIVCEVVGTSFLKASNGFAVPLPAVMTALFYGAAFYLLAFIVRVMPVGVVYAIWSGMGVVLIGLVGWLVFDQTLNVPTIIGMIMIILGVVLVNLFSVIPH